MNNYQSKELQYLTQRGYLKQISHGDALDKLFLSGKKITFYIGFDCTAKSLHVGHLIPIMVIRYLVRMGHRAITILGTTTAQIGDPSLKSEQRKMLSKETVHENYLSISKIVERFIDSPNEEQNLFLKNDWLETANLVDFLRDYGAYFSVNRMVNMETFKNRLENQQPLSFLEFSYSLFQAYDFAYLYKQYNCQLQIGGSDQWGNIISGLDLCQKLYNGAEVFGATVDLLLNSAGQKMGKTVGGAIWLNAEMFSPFDYWQYFRNLDDADVIKVAQLLTELSNKEIEELKIKLQNGSDEINAIKILIATEITRICHGEEIAKKIEEGAKIKFSNQDDLSGVESDLRLSIKDLEDLTILKLLKKLKPASSNSQLKTLIEQKSVKLNDEVISDLNYLLVEDIFKDYNGRSLSKVSIGKKEKFFLEII